MSVAGIAVCLAAGLRLYAADPEAAVILAKSVAALQKNLEAEKHWNYSSTETRQLVNAGGTPVQMMPVVKSEAVILGDGRRCNAVTFWGDGHQPYMKDAAPEDRCLAYNSIGMPFQTAMLLKSANAKVTERTAKTVTIAVAPDRSHESDPNYNVRCAAAIEGKILVDVATSFPLEISGKVVDKGCDGDFKPVMHDTPIDRGPMTGNFRKGSTFRVVWSLQKDKFDNSANSYWITTEQHYDQPISGEMTVLYYWGRQFRIRTTAGKRLVKDVTTTAQEFGAGSTLTFK
ncbi:MAG TPA: hypothetical protein VKE70_18540 [Candidatus Solibacter sp.]|nr:hypothetical protein [Candidatus Solibacter sp.]